MPLPIALQKCRDVLACAALGIALASCSSAGTGKAPHSTAASSSAHHSLPLVSGRASHPSNVEAPGIQVPRGYFNVQVGSHTIAVTAHNWNTIIATSNVSPIVG